MTTSKNAKAHPMEKLPKAWLNKEGNTMDKATARPWYHDNTDCKQKHLHNLCALVVDSEGTTVAHAFGDDAKLIVKAVNSHDTIVGLLKEIEADCMDRGDSLLWTKLGTKIRSAIAKAEGK